MTPIKSKSLDFAEVKRVCQDCTLTGFKAIYESGAARPFRFVYFSGVVIMDDYKAKKPFFLGDYIVMRVSHRPFFWICYLSADHVANPSLRLKP